MAITVQEAQVIFSADGLNQVKTQASAAGVALDRATSKAGGLASKLSGIKNAITGLPGMLAGLGAGAAGGMMMKLAAGAEQTAIAFEVLLGSASASKAMVDSLRALDMKSVFGMRELGDAAKMMLNYGVAGDEVTSMLSVISDIASGDAMKLEGLTRAFGQMSATGRLMGQDLNQMIQHGFNPLKAISDKTGVSMAELKKQMEAGQISTDMVKRAFESATQEGGRFHGMNDRMSKTTAGQFAKLKSNIEMLAIEIGTQLLPVANELIGWATKMITATEGIGTKFGAMVATARQWFADVSDSVADMGVVVGTVTGEMLIRWQNMFDGIKAYASAVFEWMSANAGVVAENMAARLENARLRLTGKTTETVHGIDDWGRPISYEKSLLQPTNREFTPFAAPVMPQRATRGMMDVINEELATARKLRQEGRNAADKAKEDKVKGKDETSVPEGLRGRDIVPQEVREGKSQTLSAEALFGSLREGALNKQLGIMKQGLGLQQQQLDAANQLVAKVDKMNLGLA